jgi:hypothetical protein
MAPHRLHNNIYIKMLPAFGQHSPGSMGPKSSFSQLLSVLPPFRTDYINNFRKINPGTPYKTEQPDFKIHIASEPSQGSALSKFSSLERCHVAPLLHKLPMFRVSRTVHETIAGLFVTFIAETFRRLSRSNLVCHVTSVAWAPDVTFLR